MHTYLLYIHAPKRVTLSMEGKLHVRWYHCVSFIYLQLAAINNDNSSFLNISDGGIEKYEIGMSFVMNCFFI